MLFDLFHSKRPAPLRVEDYLDDKNRSLFDFVNSSLTLTLQRTTAPYYGIHLRNSVGVIEVPARDPQPASFAHELLHAKLWIKQVYCSPKLAVSGCPKLVPIFSEELCDHFTNILEHRKMFPEFIAMGYKEQEFLADSQTPALTKESADYLLLKIKFHGFYLAPGVGDFIGTYLAARLGCFSYYDYSEELQILRNAEPELSSILDSLAESWNKYDYEKEGDILATSYIEVIGDFVENLNEWAIVNIKQ